MEPPQSSDQDARIAELGARLAEAEETLRAIRGGEVDALLVSRPEGDQVFTLQGAETTYRFLVEEMNEGALLLGPEGTVLYANTRFADLADVPLERAIGMPWESFFASTDRPRFAGLLAAARSSCVREELHLQSERGSRRPVGVSLCSMQRERVQGFSVVLTDLSERKAAEAALREANETLELRVAQRTSQLTRANELLLAEMGERKRTEAGLRRHREWLRVTLTSIGDAVIACDDQGRVTFINVIAASLTGWQPEEARGQPVANVFKIINEQTRQPAEDIVPRVLREQRVLGLANHTVLISRDGREIPVEDSAAPIMDASRTMLGVVLVFHDVTEKRRAEEILSRNREELERLVAQRTAKLQEMISELQHVSYSIVHDLRAPLRAMQGFAALLEEECAGCAKTAVVLGNQALLTQCFSNLLGNAVKFVAPDTIPQVRVRAEMLDGTARVWIEDNGIGIAKDLQGRLFGMFQRLTQDYEGTGMGLAIVRKVVERMGGKVGLESEEGKGSRFWVELRAVSGDDVPVAPADEVR